MDFFIQAQSDLNNLLAQEIFNNHAMHFMKNPTPDEQEYFKTVIGNIISRNVKGVIKEAFDLKEGQSKTKTLVSYTKGQSKPENKPKNIDYQFNHDMNLNKRCDLLYSFNKVLATSIGNELFGFEYSGVSYTKEINKNKGTCKIFRHFDLDKVKKQI